MKKARLYKQSGNQRVECQACSWYCKIAPGQVGICGTRLNRKGTLYSLVYGKAIGLHMDPVEKKPLFHFLPGKTLLSFGTVGCNFGCLFCQNWDMSQVNKSEKFKVKREKLDEELITIIDRVSETVTPKEIVDMAVGQGAAGIAYTYNEPAIFVEFAHDTAKIAHRKGLKNIYVSNGFESIETFNYLEKYLDAINIDLKSYRSEFYQKICKSKIEPVLENIKRFFNSGIETEVTTLVIPGYNDSSQELKDIARFICSISPDIPWHISAFYPAYKLTDAPPTPVGKLKDAYNTGKKAGLKYIYTGNVYDPEHCATYCPKCNNKLIARDGYNVSVDDLDTKNGKCQNCGQKIYGVWN